MGSRALWLLVMTVVVYSQYKHNSSFCCGCLEEERDALFQIKSTIIPSGYYSLSSWSEEEAARNCCQWERIVCNHTTRRVISINLRDIRGHRFEKWYLNASLFLPFPQLNSLSISANSLAGCVENEGFERLAMLRNLQSIDLSDNHLNNDIVPSLSRLSSLQHLDLSYNKLNGSINFQDFGGSSSLHNLEELILYGNKFNNRDLKSLSGLSRLRSLALGYNQLSGAIQISDLDTLSNLEELDMRGNSINNFVKIEGFERLAMLRNIQSIDLSFNHLNNDIVPSLSRLSSLKHLDLSYNNLNGSIDFQDGFANLKTLSLSGNHIEDFEATKGLGGPSMLSSLEELKLQGNQLSNRILKSLSGFESLKSLDLGDNQLHGTIEMNDFDALSNLEELDMSGNNVKIEGFKNLSNLEHFYLDSNYFIEMDFLQSIGVLTSLKELSLVNCSLSGALPNQGWCELPNLKILFLSENQLSGILPPCMANLTSLEVVDLSRNQFVGNIGSSPLTTLTSLQWLLFSNNYFEVPLLLSSFANHSYLKVLGAGNNQFIADPMLDNPTTFELQLEYVDFQNCLLTHLDAVPTNFLYFQFHLVVLDLSHNNIGGTFPSWILGNNSRLKDIGLRNNTFEGPLELPSHVYSNVSNIDISHNDFGGHIPANISSVFPNLNTLNMSRNRFEGNHLFHFSNMNSLWLLDLSNNHLSGMLQKHLPMCCPSLRFFKLSNNNMSGQIPHTYFDISRIHFLYLNGNNFMGEIPYSISPMYLYVLDISNNQFTGKLPKWLGNQTDLQELVISKNHLQGPIPTELCKLDWLVFLDLSENNLSGSIPDCFSMSRIRNLHLAKNKLNGQLPHVFFNSSSLVTLDLRDNFISGSIPTQIGNDSSLSILLLRANHLTGKISSQLCHLQKLCLLDLSQNSLSGSIPPCLGKIAFKAIDHFIPFQSPIYGQNDDMLPSMPSSAKHYWLLGWDSVFSSYGVLDVQEEVKFSSKSRYESYEGNILNFMSGIDLSCNQLTGELPPGIGNLRNIRALNFSHNQLVRSIPKTFSNLEMLESLDLSFNNLSGKIPEQLVDLTFLEVFNISYNNLSGKTPDRKAQFGTFEESSYEGNPYLCGPPLKKPCTQIEPVLSLPSPPKGKEGDAEFIDMGAFKVSFLVSYMIMLLGTSTALYINPYWRRTWFYLIEMGITTSYYFFVDNFDRLFRSRKI